jgi:hypothetical protein
MRPWGPPCGFGDGGNGGLGSGVAITTGGFANAIRPNTNKQSAINGTMLLVGAGRFCGSLAVGSIRYPSPPRRKS